MKSNWKKIMATTALTSVLAASAMAWSGAGPYGKGGDPMRMFGYMSERLDLSDEQQTEVGALMAVAKQERSEDKSRMKELRSELMAMKADFDEGRAQSIADEIGQITSRMVYQMSSTFAQVYGVLDADQKAELDSMLAKRGDRSGSWKRTKGDPQ
ncbi:MAG: Spy/CpxP family protein refolding chaperone [Pseudomonadota bacterium]